MTAPAAPEPVTASFGRRVLALRKEQRMSRQQLIRRALVSESALRRIEHGQNTTLAVADRVSAALGRKLAELVAPVSCLACLDEGHPGFTCDTCGKSGTGAAS